MDEQKQFLEVYNLLKSEGQEVSPRGLKTLEIENFGYNFHPRTRFVNFESRKFNVNYVKKEFMWYLNADKHDLSITQHAKLWNNFISEGNVIHSNYGQYLFGESKGFELALNALIDDKDSRRSTIPILQPYHLNEKKIVDVPCTYGLAFRIRNNKLNMTVKMRSNDAYYGLASDLPIFSFIFEMMYVKLKVHYPSLSQGNYYHFVESFHIYEERFSFLENVFTDEYVEIDVPSMTPFEVNAMLDNRLDTCTDEHKFVKWLKDN